MFSRIR
jgi:hypothetical protein